MYFPSLNIMNRLCRRCERQGEEEQRLPDHLGAAPSVYFPSFALWFLSFYITARIGWVDVIVWTRSERERRSR